MAEARHGIRSIVRIGYDGRVYKTFRGTDRQQRFENEIKVLNELEARECDFVPRILSFSESTLTLVTTGCGKPPKKIPQSRVDQIFQELRQDFGVIHSDPTAKNITFDPSRKKFCVVDFEQATIEGSPAEHRPATRLHWAGKTKSGIRKEKNEDSLALFCSKDQWVFEDLDQAAPKELVDNNAFFIVSDGMGGHAGGATASKLTIEELHRIFQAKVGDLTEAGTPSSMMESAILAIHTHVNKAAQTTPELQGMGATVVCSWFNGNQLHIGHIGDSRLYRFRNNQLEQLTEDHSLVGKLVQKGKLTEEEARNHPRRNVLTQAIGGGCGLIYPQIEGRNVHPGDWYIICTDGVIDGLWDFQIEQELLVGVIANSPPEEVAQTLLNTAFDNAGRDDTTLFVIRVE